MEGRLKSVLFLCLLFTSQIMPFSGQRTGLWVKVAATSDEKSGGVRAVMIVGTRLGKNWLDLVALASLPPLYRLMEGMPLMLICDDVTTRLDPNSEKFLLQYQPQKVILIGDDLFSPDITALIPDVLTQQIVGNTLDELTVKISKEFFSNSSSAILVKEADYASALTITPYASYTNTPIFYYQENVSETVLNELHRLGVQKIILPNPSEEIVEVLEPFALDIVPSLQEIVDRTAGYLGSVEYTTVTNPLDRENGNKVSLVAPLFTLLHQGILIPINYNMTTISVPIGSYSLTTERPLGAPDAPLRYCDFEAFEEQPPRENGSTWAMYPVNETFFETSLSDLNPFDTAGIYFTNCYLGASIQNSTEIDMIAIDLDRNGKIADNEVFRIINGTLTITRSMGDYKFENITFEDFSERKIGRGISLICKSSTWIRGQVIFEGNAVDFILSPSLTDIIDPLWNPWRGAYRYCPVSYVLLNFDWNDNGDFNNLSEGPYTVGNTFMYGNTKYLLDFNFPSIYENIGEIRLISPSPSILLSLIDSKVSDLQTKFLCLVGSEDFVPMQCSVEPRVKRSLLWGDYNYSGLNVDSLYPAVGRINAYDATDSSLVYLRTATYCQIQSSYPTGKALVLCDHVPPYSVSELKQAGYEVSLMGFMNYSTEKTWENMRDSDIVLINVGHATWPFEYAEPEFSKPSLVVHWMCKSAYENVGYKRFFHAGAALFIGTTEVMAGPEGGDVELIHALLNQMLIQNSTIGEAFNRAKLFVSLRIKEMRVIPCYARGWKLRVLTILGSSIFGDPAFRMCSSREVNNTVNYSDLYGFCPLNSTHKLAYVDVNASFQSASWWDTYTGAWCGLEKLIDVSHFTVEGVSVSQFEQSVPFGPNWGGSAEILLPTVLFTYAMPENAAIFNITLIFSIPYVTVWKEMWGVPKIEPFSGKYILFKAGDAQYVTWNSIIAEYDKENKTLIWFADEVSFRIYLLMPTNEYVIIDQSIVINDGNTYTNSTTVTLSLSAADATAGVSQMRFSNDNITWTFWEAYSVSKAWTLAIGDGAKIVYAQFMDNIGLVSTYSDNILLDTTAPNVKVTIPSHEIRSSTVTAAWTVSDNVSGISHCEVRLDGGSWINLGTGTTHTFSGLGDGNHSIYVKAIDKAGNTRQDIVNFTVNTSLIGGPGWTDDIIAISALVIVILVAFLYLLKIRKH